MAPYTPVNYGLLKDAVASDLRDPLYKTFTKAQVGALVNEGIAEMDRIRPWERYVFLAFTYPSLVVTVDAQQVLAVEVQSEDNGSWSLVPECSHTLPGIAQDGWDQWGDTLFLPQRMTLAVGMEFRALVYAQRDPLKNDTDVPTFLDMTDEEVVRCYARWTALEALLHDRTLYQQWQTQANNSDVSPTQLLQMAGNFKQEWSDLRKRALRLRRVM